MKQLFSHSLNFWPSTLHSKLKVEKTCSVLHSNSELSLFYPLVVVLGSFTTRFDWYWSLHGNMRKWPNNCQQTILSCPELVKFWLVCGDWWHHFSPAEPRPLQISKKSADKIQILNNTVYSYIVRPTTYNKKPIKITVFKSVCWNHIVYRVILCRRICLVLSHKGYFFYTSQST